MNQDGLLYYTKKDAIKYIISQSRKYDFDMEVEGYEDKKDEYNIHITWKSNRILDGFVRIDDDNNNKWWMGFKYFYIT